MKFQTTFALAALAIALALAGCSSTQPVAPVREPVAEVKPAPPPVTTPANTGAIPNVSPPVAESIDPLKDFSVYFDLDQYTVDDKQIPVVQRHANYMKQNPAKRASIQGNTDERGSREYNLSLGQKRAEAVKKLLVTMGAKESQIEAVSFGEEKPKDPGHDEAAWSKNRRSDITYPQ